jgi:hypothetical protein
MTLAVRLSQVSIQEPDGWQLVALNRAPRQTPRNGAKGHTLKLQIADFVRMKMRLLPEILLCRSPGSARLG